MMQLPVPPGVDVNFLFSQAVPVLEIAVLLLFTGLALRWLARSPVGEALAERIREGTARRRHGSDAGVSEPRLAELEHRLLSLDGQVSELAERLDFAERLLAERRERKLGAGQ
jgi:hypothetical protein